MQTTRVVSYTIQEIIDIRKIPNRERISYMGQIHEE